MKLYEITEELQVLDDLMLNSVDEETGEILDTEILDELYDGIGSILESKASSIIGYVQSKKAELEAVDNEIKRLTAMKKTRKKKLDNFQDYVKFNIAKTGKKKIETELGNISIRKTSKLEIINEEVVPECYKTKVETIKIDKTKIKKDLKSEDIKGVKLVEGLSMTIK